MDKIYFFSYFSELVRGNRNAPLASESISLFIKDILDSKFSHDEFDIHYVNLANSKKCFAFEKNISRGNFHQIGTRCFGRLYRKLIWKNLYWKAIYKFCKRNVSKDDVLIFYHSTYTSHLFKKLKNKIHCKIILIGAELYSDVTGNNKQHKLEIESYSYSNAHILISESLRKKLNITRPYLILSGDYRSFDKFGEKLSIKNNKINLVYAGTFDPIKGGVFSAINAMDYLSDNYVLHILGFGDSQPVLNLIKEKDCGHRIVFEGVKQGDSLLEFLSRCDIGLSTQDSSKVFNTSSFPSKIITYEKCGLPIVSTPSPSVIDSPFKNFVAFSKSCSPIDIADAIKSVGDKKDYLKELETIRESFINDFCNLVRYVFSRKRYLVLNNCYGGSTGSLSRKISSHLLEKGDDSIFRYHIGSRPKNPFELKYGFIFEHYLSALLTRFTGNCYGNMLIATSILKRYTKKMQFDLINLHCMNSYSLNLWRYFKFIKSSSLKAVVTNHALFYATGTCGYPFGECNKYLTKCGNCPNKRYSCKSWIKDTTKHNWEKMNKALNNSQIYMTSVSNYVRGFCNLSPITKQIENKTILNGIDTNIFANKSNTYNDGKVHILYISSSIKNSNKGFLQFLQIVEMFKDNDQFIFHVIGDKKINLSSYKNIVFHGFVSDKNNLARLYSSCHLFLLTSRKETFSLPVAESLCCGTPVVGYKCGGPESFADKRYAKFFDFGDTNGIANYILSEEYLKIDKKAISMECSNMYANNKMLNDYIEYFDIILNGKDKT